jgi:4-hydroxy-tetrahydrodipicolinate synthase
MSARVGGVIPAVVTPFAAGGGRVDLDAIDAHVAWLHERGVRCIAPLGTNGEGPSLSLRERMAVVERLAAHPSGVALLPGTGATSLPETIELSRHAVGHGAAGVLVAPPSYFGAERDGVVRYYGALLDALPDEARVFLYHVPAYTGVPIEVQHVAALRATHGERVAGVKDSGGRVEHTAALLRAVPELTILSGSDGNVAAAFRAGAHGVVSALANAVPELVEAVRAAVAAGRSGEEEQATLSRLRALTKAVPQRAALKALVAAVAGVPRAAVRPPQAELEPDELRALLEGFAAVAGAAVREKEPV